MTKETNVTIIESTMLPALTNEVKLVQSNGKYTIEGYDALIKKIDGFIDMVDSYDYQEEDRADIKKLKAETNKFTKAITDSIKEATQELFGNINDEKAELTAKLAKLVTLLNRGLDESDKRFKQEKLAELTELFESAKSNFDHLVKTELVLNDILVNSWLNRSASKNKTVKEMNKRLTAIDQLIGSPMCPTDNVDTTLDALEGNDWDAMSALNELIEDEKKRQEAELEKAIKEQLKAQQQDDAPAVKPQKLVKFNADDWSRVKSMLLAAGIEFTEV